MRLRIHRGTREIGGTCIELESEGARILLDLGLPLNASDLASTPLPNTSTTLWLLVVADSSLPICRHAGWKQGPISVHELLLTPHWHKTQSWRHPRTWAEFT